MAEDRAEQLAAVAAFLAMAVKQGLILNGRTAREAWDAFTELLGLSPAEANELLCRMLGEEDEP